MRKNPILKNELTPEQLLIHIPFLADLAAKGSITAVARERNTTPEAIAYHLHILNAALGSVYEVRRGSKAELTVRGWELLAVFEPLNQSRVGCVGWLSEQMSLKSHANCVNSFPSTGKVFSGTDRFPDIRHRRQKLIIECLSCGLKVMVLLRSYVKQWLKLHDAEINGPHPLFRLHSIGDEPTPHC
ncbi:MAG: hypothetical protein NW701_17910 [Nitrospira sp.]